MDCIFCQIVAGSIPAKLVAESDDAVAFHDLNPQAPVHVLVIPRQHFATAADAIRGELSKAGEGSDQVIAAVMRLGVEVAHEMDLHGSGYRFVINTGVEGGQTVDHLHLHVLGGRRMTWPPG